MVECRALGVFGYTIDVASMHPSTAVQLGLSFALEPPAVSAGPCPTLALQRHRSRRRILDMVHFALRYFPEVDARELRVGITRRADGYASLESPMIWLNPRGLCYQTIAHELVHLLQGKGLVPMGERSCDVYSLARDRILVDAAPVYLEIPDVFSSPKGGLKPGAAFLLHTTAREAIRRRGAGERRYIQWFERRLATVADRA